jgi:acyl-CoA thioester hydrolase
MTDDLAPFRFRCPVAVRFSDIDVGGHAHHSHALAYFEEARWRYWTEVAGAPPTLDSVDYILAEARIRYRARVLFPDTLSVGVRAGSVGRTHVELFYEARNGAGVVVLEGETVLVLYDYAQGVPRGVSAEVRARLEAHEARPLPRRRDPRGES